MAITDMRIDRAAYIADPWYHNLLFDIVIDIMLKNQLVSFLPFWWQIREPPIFRTPSGHYTDVANTIIQLWCLWVYNFIVYGQPSCFIWSTDQKSEMNIDWPRRWVTLCCGCSGIQHDIVYHPTQFSTTGSADLPPVSFFYKAIGNTIPSIEIKFKKLLYRLCCKTHPHRVYPITKSN